MAQDGDGTPRDLAHLLDTAWDCLLRGVRDREAPARHPTCATVGPDGWPEARTLVLRAAERAGATLDLHTDRLSAKLASLDAAPRMAVHVWDEGLRLQLRLRCEVDVLTHPRAGDGTGRAAEVAALWDAVPEPSRAGYGSVPPPGTPIGGALDYRRAPDPGRFAVLRCRVLAIEALHLGTEHRRARFDRADDWAGRWVAP